MPMDVQELFDLTGKVAVITGGAGGIGVVYAEALADAGASVVIADVDHDAATHTAEALGGKGIPGHRRASSTSARRIPPRRWRAAPSTRSAAIDILSTTRR